MALAFFANTEKNKYRAFLLTDTSSTGTVQALHAAATEAAGENSFAEIVELDGTAQPGPGGLLTAPLSGTECVWYRQRVTRRYKEARRDQDGNRRVETKNEVVSDNTSNNAFRLRDADGEVSLLPKGIDAARKVVDEFRAEEQQSGTKIQIGALTLGGGSREGDTVGYKREEWVLTAGTRIYVRGEAADRGGEVEIRTPRDKKEKLVISTRSEDEILSAHQKHTTLYTVDAAACGVLAVGLGVAAIFV